MDDSVKTAAISLLVAALVHAALSEHARHEAMRKLRATLGAGGELKVTITTDSPFGMLWGGIRRLDVYGTGETIARLPLTISPGSGLAGHIRHLGLHLRDFTLNGHAIARLDAEVPHVAYDLWSAVARDRLVLRTAGVGSATVYLTSRDLSLFVNSKFHYLLSDGDVTLDPPNIHLRANSRLLGGGLPVTITGRLSADGGRFVDVTGSTISVGTSIVGKGMTDLLMGRLNPVLDVDTDLGLGPFLRVGSLIVGNDIVRVLGDVSIPVESTSPR